MELLWVACIPVGNATHNIIINIAFFLSFSLFIRCFYTFWCFVSRGHVKTFQTDFTAIQWSEYQTWYPIFYQFFTFQACNSISETNVWNCNAYDKSNQYSLSFKQTKQTIYLRYSRWHMCACWTDIRYLPYG